jgi:hypothetical protein
MNIYLVSRTDEVDWDEYDSVVVVAETPKEARKIAPVDDGTWKNLSVKLIGSAKMGIKKGIILESYNAG